MIKISDAELEIMKIIWKRKEVTSGEVINEFKKQNPTGYNWRDNTIRTLLNRLIAKKAVGISKKNGKTYTYVPLIKENEYKIKKSRNLVDQLYHGSIKEVILNLVDNNELSQDDLHVLIDEIEKKIS